MKLKTSKMYLLFALLGISAIQAVVVGGHQLQLHNNNRNGYRYNGPAHKYLPVEEPQHHNSLDHANHHSQEHHQQGFNGPYSSQYYEVQQHEREHQQHQQGQQLHKQGQQLHQPQSKEELSWASVFARQQHHQGPGHQQQHHQGAGLQQQHYQVAKAQQQYYQGSGPHPQGSDYQQYHQGSSDQLHQGLEQHHQGLEQHHQISDHQENHDVSAYQQNQGSGQHQHHQGSGQQTHHQGQQQHRNEYFYEPVYSHQQQQHHSGNQQQQHSGWNGGSWHSNQKGESWNLNPRKEGESWPIGQISQQQQPSTNLRPDLWQPIHSVLELEKLPYAEAHASSHKRISASGMEHAYTLSSDADHDRFIGLDSTDTHLMTQSLPDAYRKKLFNSPASPSSLDGFLQMQSHSYQLPSTHTTPKEYPEQHQQQGGLSGNRQYLHPSSSSSSTHLSQLSLTAQNSLNHPSREFQPPYY
ncbi:hypothetical protein KR009_000690 [Drosophila setifemur]|nr:hypothetical protein KR009_000690 [Drosophila setifemur]